MDRSVETSGESHEILAAMRDWIETVGIVPAVLSAYAPLVVDGLMYFLGRLPPTRLEAIVAGQLALDETATADDRLVALVRECPTLHKLGQVVARQAGLPVELRERLQTLETLTPPPGGYGIAAIVAHELGEIPGLAIDAEALAEGSVAFVVPFTLRATDGSVRRGVFKALKPGAEERLLEDLAVWPHLGDYLQERSAQAGLARLDFRTLLKGVGDLLRNEIRLDLEQEQLRRARRFYAHTPGVVIPELFALCTPRITAMERIDGVKVTDATLAPAVRRRLARTIVTALLAMPFWSAASDEAFFHADPHAGNLFATPNGKLAIFDWALTTRLDEAQLAAVVQLLVGAAALDENAVIDALAGLGTIENSAEARTAVAHGLAEVRRGTVPGFAWLTPLLDGLGRTGAVTFPEQTALFRKSLLTLSGVIRDVCSSASVDDVLLAEGGRCFASESWLRPLVPFDSRALPTHVSNLDLVRFLTTLSFAPARYALGMYRDAIEAFTPPGTEVITSRFIVSLENSPLAASAPLSSSRRSDRRISVFGSRLLITLATREHGAGTRNFCCLILAGQHGSTVWPCA